MGTWAAALGCSQSTQAAPAVPRAQRCQFRALFPDASAAAVDLLEAMLQFDPRKRITVEQARCPACSAALLHSCLQYARLPVLTFGADTQQVRMPCMHLCSKTKHDAQALCLQGLYQGVQLLPTALQPSIWKDALHLHESQSTRKGTSCLPSRWRSARQAHALCGCVQYKAMQSRLPLSHAGRPRRRWRTRTWRSCTTRPPSLPRPVRPELACQAGLDLDYATCTALD